MTIRREMVESRGETGRVETRGPEAYLEQYVEGPSGEPARLHTAQAVCRLVAVANPPLQQKRS